MRRRAERDPAFQPTATTVGVDYLVAEGLGARFVRYMRAFEGFVRPD